MKYSTVMETKAVLGKFMLATGVAIAALSAQGLDQTPIVKAKTAETKTAEGRLNTLPWNGTINGVTLPAPAGRTKVCEYKVKEDAVTIRIDGMEWKEFVAYCKVLEALPGWTKSKRETVAKLPEKPRDNGIVYFTGALEGLPRVNVRFNGEKYCAKHKLANFSIFAFIKW